MGGDWKLSFIRSRKPGRWNHLGERAVVAKCCPQLTTWSSVQLVHPREQLVDCPHGDLLQNPHLLQSPNALLVQTLHLIRGYQDGYTVSHVELVWIEDGAG